VTNKSIVLAIACLGLTVGCGPQEAPSTDPLDDPGATGAPHDGKPGTGTDETPETPATPSTPGTPTPGTPGTPGAPAFKAGDLFDYAKVEKPSQMVATMIASFGYAASTAPKAIAINADGLGFVAVKPGATKDEVELIAKQACFVIGGAKPCALLASGAVFAQDAAKVAAPDFTFTKPTTIANVPFVIASDAAGINSYYATVTGPKAIAIGLDGVVGEGYTRNTSFAPTNEQDAQRVALERCEMKSRFAPCTLLASAAVVAYEPISANFTPVIDYARTALQANLPGAVGRVWTQVLATDYYPKTPGLPGAVYISRKGAGGYYTGGSAATADAQAKNQCVAQAGTEPCVKYATNRTVTFRATDIEAMEAGNREVHCKAMPRTSCAAHKAIGCTAAGDFYIKGGGGVTLEKCM